MLTFFVASSSCLFKDSLSNKVTPSYFPIWQSLTDVRVGYYLQWFDFTSVISVLIVQTVPIPHTPVGLPAGHLRLTLIWCNSREDCRLGKARFWIDFSHLMLMYIQNSTGSCSTGAGPNEWPFHDLPLVLFWKLCIQFSKSPLWRSGIMSELGVDVEPCRKPRLILAVYHQLALLLPWL